MWDSAVRALRALAVMCLVATVLPNVSSGQDRTEIGVYEAALEYGSSVSRNGPVFLAAGSFRGEEGSDLEERQRRLKVDSVRRALGLAIRTFDEVSRCEPGAPTRDCELLVPNYVHLSNARFEGDGATVTMSWSTPAARRTWVLRFEKRETGWELDRVLIRGRGHVGG